MILLPTTAAVEWRPTSPFTRSTCLSAPMMTPCLRSTTPSLPNESHGNAGLRIQRDHPVTNRDKNDALVAQSVCPICKSTTRKLPGRHIRPAAFIHPVHPQQLACLPIQGNGGPPGPCGRVDDTLDHQRRSFQLVLGTRAEGIGLEAPRHFEIVKIFGVDLVQRRVLASRQIGGVLGPLTVCRAGLCCVLTLAGRAVLTRPRCHHHREPADNDQNGQNRVQKSSRHLLPPISVARTHRPKVISHRHLQWKPGGAPGDTRPWIGDPGMIASLEQKRTRVISTKSIFSKGLDAPIGVEPAPVVKRSNQVAACHLSTR